MGQSLLDTIDLKIPSGITAPVVGDFTGDGVPDLVVHSADSVRVYPGLGKGALGAAVVTALGEVEARRYRHAAVAGDFNLDGKLDYFAYGRVWLGNGDGSLRLSAKVLIENEPQLMQFNDDGIPDLVGMAGDRYQVLFGSADGKFCFPKYYCDPAIEFGPLGMGLLGDLNNDAKPDVVTLFKSSDRQMVQSWMGVQAEKSPGAVVIANLGWVLVKRVGLADVDGDGFLDLVSLWSHPSYKPGDGRGGFGEPKAGDFLDYFDSIEDGVLADFNGDGRLDLGYYLTHEDPVPSGEFGVLLNDGQGRFGVRVVAGTGPLQGGTVGFGDLNQDGRPDLIFDDLATIRVGLSSPIAVSSASGSSALAPGALATIYGSGLSDVTAAVGALSSLPRSLGGVSVRVFNPLETSSAELLYVSPTQINFRVPAKTWPGLRAAQVQWGNKTFDFWISVMPTAPALFTVDGVNATAAVVQAGDKFDVTLYGSGLDGVSTGFVVANGSSFTVESITSSSSVAGLNLVRVLLPKVSGKVTLRLVANGAVSNDVVVDLK